MPHSVVNPLALIMAPAADDAAVFLLLKDMGVATRSVDDIGALAQQLEDNVLLVAIAEEALLKADPAPLVNRLRQQPEWADMPFIVLTSQGGGPERSPLATHIFETVGNVAFVERPFHATTFMSLARTALTARRRQYERRATLEQLRESDERLRTALIAGRLGDWEFHVDTHDLAASDDCKAMFGWAPDERFTWSDVIAMVRPDDLSRMQRAVQHTIATGEDYVVEHRALRRDGVDIWVEVRARLAPLAGRLRLVGVCADITARRGAEEQLRTQNETLEARVRARTEELEALHSVALDQIAQREMAERKLRQSQKMEMIGQLTGGIAHDFNNLLMAVLGNLELLKKHLPDDARAQRLIDGAQQGAQRGASLTQRLLAFARKQDLSLAITDPGELVRSLRPLIERTIGSTIELRVDIADKPGLIEVDSNQVELALLNLVVNARDAMPEGGVLSIAIDSGVWRLDDDAPTRCVRLSVTDTGHGMDSATLEKAAEPFFSTKGVGKGTGLGLSMIHGLLQQLGGQFRLSSAVGAGATAEMLFPVAADHSDVQTTSPPLAAAHDPAPGRRLRILMVDDDALIAMSSVDMLEDLGHEVIEANSGEAALRHLTGDEHVDLLITDFSMPRMNGAQLAIAARGLRPDLPIILATGYAELPAGAGIELPRIGKPYDQRQLQNQIDLMMAARR